MSGFLAKIHGRTDGQTFLDSWWGSRGGAEGSGSDVRERDENGLNITE